MVVAFPNAIHCSRNFYTASNRSFVFLRKNASNSFLVRALPQIQKFTTLPKTPSWMTLISALRLSLPIILRYPQNQGD